MRDRKLVAVAGALAAACIAATVSWQAAEAGQPRQASVGARPYEIGLFGDMPYGDTGRAQ
ncbi:MAG TPA: hypothetical protein VF053_01035 [Streptosporangiales bacterium]